MRTRRTALLFSVFIFIFAFSVCFQASAEDGSLHPELRLSSEWTNKTGYNEGAGKWFSRWDGAMVAQIAVSTELLIGEDIYRNYSASDLWTFFLTQKLNSVLEAYGCSGTPDVVPMDRGINCVCANTEFMGMDFVFAILQYENDAWVLMCSEGIGDSAEEVFAEVLDSIALAETAGRDGSRQEKTADGYYIAEVPVLVHLDENSLNIYTQDTPEDSLTMQRTEKDKATMDWYVQGLNAKMVISYPDILPPDFRIEIRVKDNKYSGVTDWDKMPETELSGMMALLYGNQISEYTVYQTDTALFTVFSMNYESGALRYVTVKNGDIIYVHAKRKNGDLTDSDRELLRTVADSMEFLGGEN